jgi:predicted SnoaL-like aldol condensation-catalyzing enzyme
MSTELNKALDRRYVEEVLNKGNVDVIDEIMAPAYVGHTPGLPLADRDADKGFISMVHAGFPDIQFRLEDQIAEGDDVVHRFTARGTHTGEFMGIPPTGKRAEITGINVNRFKDGKVVESWGILDTLSLMQQLGVIPTN